MFSPDEIHTLPTGHLSKLATALEGLGEFLRSTPDCEGLIVSLEGQAETALHVVDSELAARIATL